MAFIRYPNSPPGSASECRSLFSRFGNNAVILNRSARMVLTFLMIIGVGVFSVTAQTYLRESILPATGSIEKGNLILSYSLGDLSIQTVSLNASSLVNGSQYDIEIITALENHDPGMYVFPNPTSDLISLKYESDQEGIYQLRIYDLKGILFYSKTFQFDSEHQLKINLEDLKLSVGLYMMEVQKEEDVQLFKIIKI